ncbi:MAG: hypothetical protein HYX63_20510 [Gammaproteobacteria bacterium]|nr:hypothetical protein [Gammaproteobacteria bacterium]
MRIEAIYDQGRLSFLSPIKLRHERLNVIVEIPEGEIEEGAAATELDEYARQMINTLDSIRLPPPLFERPERVTAEQHERLAAFNTADDR